MERRETTTTTSVAAIPYEGGWIGYDWFKLIVAAILAALLLWFWLNQPVAVAPVAPAPAVAVTAAPAVSVPTVSAPAISAPVAPVLQSPTSGQTLPAGAVAFSGTGEPGAQVNVMLDGTKVAEAVVGADGTWTASADVGTAGDYGITVQTIGADGAMLNTSAASPVSIEAASVPTATTASLPTVDAPTGDLGAGTYELTGTGAAGQRIEVLIDGVVAGTTTVGADGTWTLPIDLVAGSYAIVAQPAGDSTAASAPIDVSVAEAVAVPPTADITPAITEPQDGAQVAAGPITISGTGTPGAQLEILDSDKVVGTVTVAEDGTWSAQVTPDATAAYSVRPAGTSEPATTAVRVTSGEVATCAELAIGCDAWVTREGGLVLRMRAAPGTSAEILTRLPVGAQMTLTEGPQPADGYTWWKVTTPGGQVGWIAGEQVRLQPD